MNLKKRFFTFAGSLVLAFTVSISASAQTGTVIADTLNVRSSTNTSSDVITKVSGGMELEILASDGLWYKVQLPDGQVGFVSAEYLSPNQAVFGVVTASNLNVRSSTGTDSAAIASLPYGTVVEILAYDGYWYKIGYQNGQTGYVSADYISLDLSLAVTTPYVVYGYINATNLNIRESTSTTANSITQLPMGTCVELLANDGLWYKIKTTDGTVGYASADYISLSPVEVPSSIVANTSAPSAPKADTAPPVTVPEVTTPPDEQTLLLGQSIIQEAKKYMGCPYVWAADGPESFDCSGFTMYVMNVFDIKLPHQSGQQYNYGYSVPKDNLIPGDLVFFSSTNTSGVAHVGIYIGDGNFIHASSGSAKSVVISPLSANYYTTHYLGARRVIG